MQTPDPQSGFPARRARTSHRFCQDSLVVCAGSAPRRENNARGKRAGAAPGSGLERHGQARASLNLSLCWDQSSIPLLRVEELAVLEHGGQELEGVLSVRLSKPKGEWAELGPLGGST